MSTFPLPPADLAGRVGSLQSDADFAAEYDFLGRALRSAIEAALPADWTWEGKRVLDFGCGAGRVLRQFVDEARSAEFVGCDIDAPSIAWLNEHLNPPLSGFVNGERPPVAQPDGRFDLIYAMSVFTHITDEWSAWLLEMHRLLAPGGLLVASFLGEGMSEPIAGEPWVEERIGMNSLRSHLGWDEGGPCVLMSPWWIREHWGRAFEIVRIDEAAARGTHGLIVARPLPEPPSREELERIDPAEPREVAALRHNLAQLQRESAAERAERDRALASVHASASWRMTAPVRRLARTLGR